MFVTFSQNYLTVEPFPSPPAPKPIWEKLYVSHRDTCSGDGALSFSENWQFLAHGYLFPTTSENMYKDTEVLAPNKWKTNRKSRKNTYHIRIYGKRNLNKMKLMVSL